MPSLLGHLAGLERSTCSDPAAVEALERRRAELHAHVRTHAQLLGRRFTSCEGTHGVFPRCDLACAPRSVNRVAYGLGVEPA